jgi:hypothetical protein
VSGAHPGLRAAAPPETLTQQLVVEPGEDAADVARALIGPKGRAQLVRVEHVPGDQWPTATYRGARRELAAIAAKAGGSHVGRPAGGAR